MPLSWNQIRSRAAEFSRNWQGAYYEKGEAHSFYNDFFDVFGVKRRSVARYEAHIKKLDNKSGFIDLFWPNVLIAEHKSLGGDLAQAGVQAGEYFDALPEFERPRYQLVCDFQHFELLDLDTNIRVEFGLAELPNNIENFAFILGKQKSFYAFKEPVNLKAAHLVGKLHESLDQTGYSGHELEQFLVRLVFCLFADSTGIFAPRDIFLDLITSRTNADGSDLGLWLTHLFQTLNTSEKSRPKTLDPDLAQFPYVSGALFVDALRIPSFTAEMREILLEACSFDWSAISPAVFGSLFQAVLSKVERRELGGHYTSELNILKVINSLFLDDLKAEFQAADTSKFKRKEALLKFQEKLGSLTFFDPAAGCGNFLVIAYREIRLLELEVLIRLRNLGGLDLTAITLSKVNVDQFFGIEVREYSARIAETALWMMDHTLNNHLSLELNVVYYRVPLRSSPRILVGDALSIDWSDVLSPERCCYVLGNPPYRGSKIHGDDNRKIIKELAGLDGGGGTLDYVCGWFLKAAKYAHENTKIAFVATNSIVKGEQIGQLWPILFDRYNLELFFAHQPFAWESEDTGKAHVYVVIVGLVNRRHEPLNKALFSYDSDGSCHLAEVRKISPYLFDADGLVDSHAVISSVKHPINIFKRCGIGTKPIDGGYYILSESERVDLLAAEPDATEFIHPYVGGNQFLRGDKRYILYVEKASPKDIAKLPRVKRIIQQVRDFRLGKLQPKNKPDSTRERGISSTALAVTPQKFHVTVVPSAPFLVVPEVTSERREYVPIAWLEPPTIPSNLVKVAQNATLVDFALLTSSMHMAWLRIIGGRLENRYRYSTDLIYNTFPIPVDKDLSKLIPFAQAILDVRSQHNGATLESLYNPSSMPLNLKSAHLKLDKAVDALYRSSKFLDDWDRVKHLLNMYSEHLRVSPSRSMVP